MKLRTLLTILIVAGITIGAIWLFNKPAPVAETAATASKAVAASKIASVVTPQVAAPVVPPTPAHASATETTTAEAPAPIASTDPHGDLNACIEDISGMLQAGNITGLVDNYAPPDVLAQMPPEARAQMEAYMSDPRAQQQLQMMAQVFQGMKGMAPTLNDTGDKATYQVPPLPGMFDNVKTGPGGSIPTTIPVTFIKQNGRWYIGDGPGGGL